MNIRNDASDALPEREGHDAPPALVDRRASAATGLASLPWRDGVEVDEVLVDALSITRVRSTGAHDQPTFLYFHGGGYRLGTAAAFTPYSTHLAAGTHTTVLSVDYRLAPENPFPAALNDAVAAYRWVLEQGTLASAIVVGGDSAGGGLAAALLQRIDALELPKPAAAVFLSPWADLRNSSASFAECAATDQLFSLEAAQEAASAYLAGYSAGDVLCSPVVGHWAGQPPTLIQVSDSEVLRNDSLELAAAIRAAGGEVDLSIYPDVAHVWHLGAPAFEPANRAIEEIGSFIARVVTG